MTTMRAAVALLLLCSALPGAEADIMAMTSGYVERQWISDTVYYRYNYGDLMYGYWAYVSPPSSVTWFGIAGFDLSSIPDSSTITGVTLTFFQAYDSGSAPWYRVRLFDDHGQSAESLYLAINTGTYLCASESAQRVWETVGLNDSAVQALQARLATDRIDMALVNAGGMSWSHVYGCQGRESLGPRLLITYEPMGISSANVGWQGAGFAVAPNPFRQVARVSGSGSGTLEVLDAAGRHAATISAGRVGDGLEPGVYFITRPGSPSRIRIVKLR